VKDEDPVACLETCRKILKDEPDNPIILLFSAGCYYHLKDYDQCLTFLEKLILLRPRDVEAHHLKGQVLAKQGHPEKALVYFDNVLKLNDRHLATVMVRAHLLDTMGRYEDAALGFRKASFIERTHYSCFRAAECYAKMKRYNEALDYYEMAHETYKFHPETYLGRARVLEEDGKIHLALDVLDEMLHEIPNNLDGMLARALVLTKMNKPEKALEVVNEVLKRGEDENMPALSLKASLLHRLKRLDEALEVYNMLLLRNPDDPVSLRAKSDILKALGDDQGAAEFDARAAKFEKVEVDELLKMGSEAWKSGKFELALVNYEKLARIEPDHPTAALGRGVALTHLGRSKEAKSALQYALALQPVTPIAHYYLGKIFAASQDYTNAAKSFKKAHKQQPDNLDALVQMGQALVQLKEFDDAADAFDQVLEIEPDHPVAKPAKLAALKAANTL
jgi:tetratricopeptide (TPR) repeat protein